MSHRAPGRPRQLLQGRRHRRNLCQIRQGERDDLPPHRGFEAHRAHPSLTTDLDPTACAAILSAAPKAETKPAAAQSDFAVHMAALGNPKIGPDGAAASGPDAAERAWGYAFAQQQPARQR